MIIKNYLNTTKEEVESKKYNVWIGISLGNKLFTSENIKEYILWALDNTKEDVLVVIGDGLHAINLEVLDGLQRIAAVRKAIRIGDKKQEEIDSILKELPNEKAKLVKVVRFQHVTASKYHEYRLGILLEEFRNNKSFHDFVIKVLKENKKVRDSDLSNEKLNSLALYVLKELPLYINGAKYGGLPEHGGKTYLLQPYPGLGLLDKLLINLQNGKSFPGLVQKLKITDKIAILEAYV